MSGKEKQKVGDFVIPIEKAKSPKAILVEQLVRTARRERLSYDEFQYVCEQARRKLGLRRARKERDLPQLLTEDEFRQFFQTIEKGGNLQHQIMLKILFLTAVRVSELVNIHVTDIDFQQCKIFINEGKGRKDRYILFPVSFRLILQSHLKANPKNKYLFETTRNTGFTTRRVQQIVKEYREKAGITAKVHPHLFRHQMITFLTKEGLTDAQIQLISGHSSKKSLEVYQHLSLKSVEGAYQEAVRKIEV